ncbi:HAD family hydrolase [Methylobacterium longum]|uniref:HAD family hydrolase n=1 Tax=Methylobacterium longum TaxID=767694 RepID=A0ABT8AWL5_9HYPH|nr:HAD family hydrolase [Methylobacterium longum]MDN3573830.1 HAD family hydrolase [Methylobacterium longum]GJE15112.1 Phosphoglycolate phosphatase [Methylobacterium longum]
MIKFSPDKLRATPRCILLDLDNTLYDYDICNESGMDTAARFAEKQLKLRAKEFIKWFGEARLEIKFALGAGAASHSRLLYFQRTLELAGYASQPLFSLQLDQAFWRSYLDKAQLFEGAADFLDDVRMANIPMAIVTDQLAQCQMRKMVTLGLVKYIDCLVSSEEIGSDKPDRRIFELALRKLGVDEGPIWMIGDSLRCDMKGSRDAVGAIGIQKVHGNIVAARSAQEADAVFRNFSELRGLFSRTVAVDGETV